MTCDKGSIEFQPKPTIHNFIDLEGRVFGRLTVIGYAGCIVPKVATWWCQCDCGTIIRVRTGNLRNGHSQSCGCLKNDTVRTRSLTHGHSVAYQRTPEFRAFHKAKGRCQSPTNKSYADYGGRGIEFRFTSVEEFVAEVGPRPSKKHSIERIDNDGHYEKGNVRWASKSEQNSNKRNNRFLTYNGRTQLLISWARERHIHYKALLQRIDSGWSVADALNKPVRKSRFNS